MFWFQRKEVEKPLDNVDLRKLNAKVIRLEAEITDLAIAQDIIRNKVLRKIQSKRIVEEEDNELTQDGFMKTN